MNSNDNLKRGVWHVSREYNGIAEAGGLKDVVAGLSEALIEEGISTAAILPRYGFIDLQSLNAEKTGIRFGLSLPDPESVEVYRCRHRGVEVYLLESQRTRDKRAIYTYTGEEERADPRKQKGTGHWDAHQINLMLQRGALELALNVGAPDVFHCHDGHSAFLPAILRLCSPYRGKLKDSRALITIHNAGRGYHQEIHDLDLAARLTGLPAEVLSAGVANGAADPFLVGAAYAPINTVSEGYAEEINSGQLEELTGGLGAAFKDRDVHLLGITNGIAPQAFDPRNPEHSGLPFAFDPARGDLSGKRRCREHFVDLLSTERDVRSGGDRRIPELAGLEVFGSLDHAGDKPLYTFVGRLTGQKGVDILAAAVDRYLSRGVGMQFLILGQGEKGIEGRLLQIAQRPQAAGKLCVLIGYNGQAAKYVYGIGDFFLVPSQYEPCGLTDLFASMMGNLPIVHAVGGLIKVRPGYTGYSYREHSVEALLAAIDETLADFAGDAQRLERLRRQAFAEVFAHYTWEKVLREGYLPLYRAEK
ncbi:MAG: glycogen/starch synthase [Spirochaetaceae bacterium]|nr:MAG: glycogen/starch synthase [Spirochaetaceae bacterium]